MQRYVEVTAKQLFELRAGLELLASLDRDAVGDLDLCLYGITTNESILDSAREAVADSEELQEGDVQLSEVAVSIPCSGDNLWALTGSGARLNREEFAYMGTGGEGVRTLTFVFAHYQPRVTLGDFSRLALALSGTAKLADLLDGFLEPR